MSFELDEILSLSDRILVMYEGRIVAEHTPDVSESELGVEMTGGRSAAALSDRVKAWLRRQGAGRPRCPSAPRVLAFAIGGLVVAATGHNPFAAYKAIFDGTGLNYLLPWTSAEDKDFAALNLQQTLILTTPLMLTALAVALPFKCGMFNIGGQGQYVVGIVAAICVGSHFAGLSKPVHLTLAARGRARRARSGAGSPAR